MFRSSTALLVCALTVLTLSGAQAADRFQRTDTGGLVSTDTGGLVSTDTGGLVSTDTGGLVSTDTGGLVSTDPGGLVSLGIDDVVTLTGFRIVGQVRGGVRVRIDFETGSRRLAQGVLMISTGSSTQYASLRFHRGDASAEVSLPLRSRSALGVIDASAWQTRSGLTAGIRLEVAPVSSKR